MFNIKPDSLANEIEKIRLLKQEELFSKWEGGILPEYESLVDIHEILDVACGPGSWALKAAEEFSKIHVVGIDKNKQMIDYARTHAQKRGIQNIEFCEMDVSASIGFPDMSFDLINARYIQGMLTIDTWPIFINECVRILRPSGILRLTETAFVESNSADFNQLISLLSSALNQTKRSSSPNRGFGMCNTLENLQCRAGLQHIQQQEWVVDFSSDAEAYEEFFEYLQIFCSPYFLGSFLVQVGVVSVAEYQKLYDRAMNAIAFPSFQATSCFITVTGKQSAASKFTYDEKTVHRFVQQKEDEYDTDYYGHGDLT